MSDLVARRWFIVACLSMPVALAGCWGKSKTSEPRGEQPKTVSHPGLLVTAEDLQSRLEQKKFRILDAGPAQRYQAEHIPGAVYVDVVKWKAQALKDGGKGLEDAAAWGKLVGRLGIGNVTDVVVYADDPRDAARIWWTLKYLGLDHVGILDGGMAAWKAANGKVSAEKPTIETAEFEPDFQHDRLAQIGELKSFLQDETAKVLDVRSPAEFDDKTTLGHIPDAANIEWQQFIAADGKFKSADEIRALLKQHGISGDDEVITHCNSGGRASLAAFALELAGVKVQNYYCGWQQYRQGGETPKSAKP